LNLRRLNLSLVAVQLVGVATLLRSIAYDRWITVLASALLLVGATAARRNKSWGVALALGAAAAFPVAWAIGIAPFWFCLVGAVGALPFLIASRAFARFDKSATAVLAMAAGGMGAVGALTWKEIAWPLFMEYPSLRPSIMAQHELLLLPVLACVILAMRVGRGGATSARLRIAETTEPTARVRVGSESSEAQAEREALSELDRELEGDTFEPRISTSASRTIVR
jgi:hypothetical protein